MAFLHEQIILPLSDLLTRQQVHRYLRFLLQSAQWSENRMAEYQDRRFRQLMSHVSVHVPFYRDWLGEHGLCAADFQTMADVVKLPIVDKAMIRNEGISRFMADNVSPRQRMVSHSSGSTGEPFEFYVSREAYSVNMAAKLRTWYDVGYRLGDSYVKLSSSPRERFTKRLQDRMTNGAVVTFNSLDDPALERILSTIEQMRPKIIRTHPNAIYYLARYRERHPGAFGFSPQFIMTTSSNLPQSFRDVIKRVFECDVIDAYSCEGTPIVVKARRIPPKPQPTMAIMLQKSTATLKCWTRTTCPLRMAWGRWSLRIFGTMPCLSSVTTRGTLCMWTKMESFSE